MKKHIAAFLFLLLPAMLQAATHPAASASRADVLAAIALCSPGDTVTVPAGTASWSGGITVNGITLQGAGKSTSGTVITAGTVTITKHASQNSKLIGFRFTSTNSLHFAIGGSVTAKPFVVGDCHYAVGETFFADITTNGGLFYNCDFIHATGTTADLIKVNLGGGTGTPAETSWNAAPSMGTDDATGETNTYFEDCTFTRLLEIAMDNDNGGRLVYRHCTFTDSGLTYHGGGSGSSGNDTSFFGNKHVEVYDCIFDRVSNSIPVNKWVWWRGGGGVFANNQLDRADSPDGFSYGGKPELRLSVGCAGGAYPRTYQTGQTELPADATPDFPILIFGNTGYNSSNGPTDSNYIAITENPNNPCSNPGSFIQLGRDYQTSNTWGWTPYPYPHPLRSGGGPTNPTVTISATDSTATEAGTTTGQFTLTASQAITATVNVSITGSAFNGADYTTIPTTVAFSAQNSRTITVTPVNDTTTEGSETVIVTILAGTGYDVGSPSNASVTIADDDVTSAYYVDQTAGSDSNPGTQALPWKNCPGMSGTSVHTGSGSLVAGNIVYFDSADTWNVSSGSSGGLYVIGGVTYIGNEYGSGTKATIRANGTIAAGVVRFRDHATIATEVRGFNIDGNNQVTTGVDFNSAFWQLMNGATKRVKDCEVHHTFSQQSLGQYKYGIIIGNDGGTGGYCENVEIINNVVHDISRDGICLYPSDSGADRRIRNILVRGNTVYNTGQDPGYTAGSGVLVKGYVVDSIIEYNTVFNTQGANYFFNSMENNHFGVGIQNCILRYNIAYGTGQGGILIFNGASGSDPMSISFYGNIVTGTYSTAGLWIDSSVGNTVTYLIYNNTFLAPVVISNPTATGTINFRNNIISVGNATPLTDSGTDIDTHSNNIFNRSSGTALVSSGGSTFTSANLSSYEATAISAVAGFVNASSTPTGFTGSYPSFTPNTTGLSMQAGSPAINNGADLGTSFNSSINSVTRVAPWDIGAYESTVTGDTTPPTVTSATINAAGTQLTLNVNEIVSFGTGGNGGLTISASGGTAILTFASGNGTNALVYNISRTIGAGETITRTYVQPTNGIEDAAGNDMASFSAQPVTNNAAGDVIAPTPNPMSFSSQPTAISSFSITMTASVAIDPVSPPVQYYFDETSGNAGGQDSGWQPSRTYTNNGLSPGIQYTYRVLARDSAITPNQTTPSSSVDVTTPIIAGGKVITPAKQTGAGFFNP